MDILAFLKGFAIPKGFTFLSLRLEWTSDGNVTCAVDPLKALCETNNLDLQEVMSSADKLSLVTIAAYLRAQEEGQEPDALMEDMFGEVLTEMRAGQVCSYPPGQA